MDITERLKIKKLLNIKDIPDFDQTAGFAARTGGGKKYFRDGIQLDKGIVLTERAVNNNREFYEKVCEFFSIYPDRYIDLIKPADSKFNLHFYQRVFMRCCARFARFCVIAPRAFSKSFLSILTMFLICIFRPGIKLFVCAPKVSQSAKIATEKLTEILEMFPFLKKEIKSQNMGTDYITLKFKHGSVFDVVSALNSQRGGRRHYGLIDETRDHDPTALNEIVLPLMNVPRRMANGRINPHEPHQGQLWMSSASGKNTFCYDKVIESLTMSITQPQKSMVWGCDIRVPMQAGLISKEYINEMKMGKTYSEGSFAREYLSLFNGSSDDSWFSYEKFERHRKMVNPEVAEKVKGNNNVFYLLSVDVARLNCQTVCTVFKVSPKEGVYRSKLVNLFVLGKTEEDKVFERQAIELKKLIKRFNPRETVIDINGLGVGLADEMIKEHFDPDTQTYLPAYGFINRNEYDKIQPRNCVKNLYGIKANGQLNSQMHGNCYARINSGLVKFLISEQNAKSKIMATKTGQKMPLEDRVKRLMPHEMTSLLINEMLNLKIKPTGKSDEIILEQSNKRMTKDKFSAFEMGLWRIKLLEDEEQSKRRNRGLVRNLVFYTSGGGRNR